MAQAAAAARPEGLLPQPALPAHLPAHLPGSLPVLLVGGYLGAGKTTLINHLLRQARGRRIAVLVNDFGSVNIDAALISAEQDESSAGVLSLAGGCLCCSFGDDLVGTMNGLAQRQPPPDVCIIELSGVALPAAVQRSLRLARAVRLEATLVLADAAHIQSQAQDPYVGDTVLQQLQAADWLLLSKADLVDTPARQAATQWLSQLAPQASIWAGVPHGLLPDFDAELQPDAALDLQPDLLSDLLLGWRPPAFSAGAGVAGVAVPSADGAAAPELDAGIFAGRRLGASKRARSVFDSLSLPLQPSNPAGLQALGQALAEPGSGVLRAKGLATDQQGRGWLLQLAAGRFDLRPMAVPTAGMPQQLVLIGLREQWDPMALRRLVQACGNP